MTGVEQVLQKQVSWMETRLDEIEVKVDGIETKVDGVEDKINTVDSKVDGIETKVDDVSETMTKVYEKLAGSELSPDGLIKDFDVLKQEVNALKEFKNKMIWAGSLIVSVGALAGYLFSLFLNYLSAKK